MLQISVTDSMGNIGLDFVSMLCLYIVPYIGHHMRGNFRPSDKLKDIKQRSTFTSVKNSLA